MAEGRTGGSLMESLIEEISRGMRLGASLAEVEAELIDSAPLDDDRKAALWMYAWSFQSPVRQRHEALQHIRMLKDRGVELSPDD